MIASWKKTGFFEALSETYLPLVQTLSRLAEKGIPGTLNLSVSPPLLHMLADPLLLGRYTQHLQKQLSLSEKEILRLANDPERLEIARFYHTRQLELIDTWDHRCGRDLLSQFRLLESRGKLSLLTCVGTHPFLPAYQSDPDEIRFQLALTVKSFETAFHKKPKGVWLPECGYFDGLDILLAEFGFEYFFLETHGVLAGATGAALWCIYSHENLCRSLLHGT
jgi:1,4-alpha-glucan branching enzyme